MTSEALRPQLSVTMKQLKLEKSVLQHERSETVTLRRPHLRLANAGPTTHTVHQKNGEVLEHWSQRPHFMLSMQVPPVMSLIKKALKLSST